MLCQAAAAAWGRWWVLATYTLLGALQSAAWALPGTLQPNYQGVYGMSQDTIQWLENEGAIGFLLAAAPTMWALDRLGLRVPIFWGLAALLASSLLRCLATDASLRSALLIHASSVLVALAGPIAMICPSKLAEDWFPPHERTTATAIAALGSNSGVIFLYLLVPLLSPTGDAAGLARMHAAMLALTAFACGMFSLYFPSYPPTPPSPSAARSRAVWQGAQVTAASLCAALARFYSCAPYLAIALTYSVVGGLTSAQGALLTQNLSQLGATEAQAGWVGAGANLGALLLGVGAARSGDALKGARAGSLKAILVLSALGAGLGYAAFALALAQGWGLWVGCAAYAAGTAALGVQVCLGFEVAAEHTFGLGPEGAMLMGIVLPANIPQIAAFLLPQSVYFVWVNWAVAGSALASAGVLLACVPSASPRLAFDRAEECRESDAEGAQQQQPLLAQGMALQ